jgi:Uma2 family endonuclease
MIVAIPSQMTLEEYLSYSDGSDRRHELVNGVLVEMGAESTINTVIASFLFASFLKLGLPAYRIGFKQKIAVRSPFITARDPDLIIHSEASFAAIEDQPEACVRLGNPVPMLVIEVVSPGAPGSDNYDRDYIAKRSEYASTEIPEYWIIDPIRSVVLVLTLENGSYRSTGFTGNDPIVSPTFPAFTVTANEILKAGR